MPPALRLMCGCCALAATLAFGAPSADSIMDAYLANYGKVVFSASEFLQERQTDGETAKVVNLIRQKPGRDYSKFLYGAAPHKGIVTADDGSRQVIYIPNESRLYEYPSGAEQAQARRRSELSRLRERFETSYVGRENIADRPCHHLRQTPKEGRGPTVDVRIDAARFVALRQEVKSGDRIWRASRFKRVDYEVELSDGDFRFTPPAGTSRIKAAPHPGDRAAAGFDYDTAGEVRRKAGFRIMEPSFVPPGFGRDAYQVGAPRPGALFHRRLSVRYLKDNDVLMVSQGIAGPIARRPGDEPTRPTQMKPGVFFWTKHEIRLLLIGPRDHDADELRKCAESVDWYDAGERDGDRHAGCGQPSGAKSYYPANGWLAPRFVDHPLDRPAPPAARCAPPEGEHAPPRKERPVSPWELEEAVLARW